MNKELERKRLEAKEASLDKEKKPMTEDQAVKMGKERKHMYTVYTYGLTRFNGYERPPSIEEVRVASPRVNPMQSLGKLVRGRTKRRSRTVEGDSPQGHCTH